MITTTRPSPAASPARHTPTCPLAAASRPAWHDRFLQLLPDIRGQARMRLRSLAPRPARRRSTKFWRGARGLRPARGTWQGRFGVCHAAGAVLARLILAGKRVGMRTNVHDVLSPYCQQRKQLTIERLDRCDRASGEWEEIAVADRHTTPAEAAATRLDFVTGPGLLPPRNRRLGQATGLRRKHPRAALCNLESRAAGSVSCGGSSTTTGASSGRAESGDRLSRCHCGRGRASSSRFAAALDRDQIRCRGELLGAGWPPAYRGEGQNSSRSLAGNLAAPTSR